jgi:kinetochore protein Spc24
MQSDLEGKWANNHNRLKLKLYRTLGIDVEADPTTGEYNKAVIRNAAKGDVHVVNIDPKFSRHFYTNYFWRTL